MQLAKGSEVLPSHFWKLSVLIFWENVVIVDLWVIFLIFKSCLKSIYLKGINFRGYLISRLEKKYILRVFNFAISVKIRNESLTEYQFFYL